MTYLSTLLANSSAFLIAFVGVIYTFIALNELFFVGRYHLGIIFAGYAFANLGFYLDAKGVFG